MTEQITLSIKAVSKYFGLHQREVSDMMANGVIDSINGEIPPKELDNFIERRKVPFKPVDPEQITSSATRMPRSGIYFLLSHRREVVYVGKSKNLFSRLGEHLRDDAKKFSHYTYIEVVDRGLDEAERYYIDLFRPKFNKTGLCRWQKDD